MSGFGWHKRVFRSINKEDRLDFTPTASDDTYMIVRPFYTFRSIASGLNLSTSILSGFTFTFYGKKILVSLVEICIEI